MTAPLTNGVLGRDGSGRFTKGNPGGPGNPHAQAVARLRSALLESVDTSDLREIVRRLVTDAKAGDLNATRILFAYTIGRPRETVDPDRVALDGERLAEEREWLQFRRERRDRIQKSLREENG